MQRRHCQPWLRAASIHFWAGCMMRLVVRVVESGGRQVAASYLWPEWNQIKILNLCVQSVPIEKGNGQKRERESRRGRWMEKAAKKMSTSCQNGDASSSPTCWPLSSDLFRVGPSMLRDWSIKLIMEQCTGCTRIARLKWSKEHFRILLNKKGTTIKEEERRKRLPSAFLSLCLPRLGQSVLRRGKRRFVKGVGGCCGRRKSATRRRIE